MGVMITLPENQHIPCKIDGFGRLFPFLLVCFSAKKISQKETG